MRHAKTPAALPGATGAGIDSTLGSVLDTTTTEGNQSYRRLVERVHALGPRSLGLVLVDLAGRDDAIGRLMAAALAASVRR